MDLFINVIPPQTNFIFLKTDYGFEQRTILAYESKCIFSSLLFCILYINILLYLKLFVYFLRFPLVTLSFVFPLVTLFSLVYCSKSYFYSLSLFTELSCSLSFKCDYCIFIDRLLVSLNYPSFVEYYPIFSPVF